MSIRHMEKQHRNTRFQLLLFFALRNLLTQVCLHVRTTRKLTFEHAKCTFIFYYFICFLLCAHILCFDAAKCSIKQFSFIYFTVSFVKQRNEHEIVTETRPIKTT